MDSGDSLTTFENGEKSAQPEGLASIEQLLKLFVRLRKAESIQEKFDLITEGIAACGWRRVHLYVIDSGGTKLKSASSWGLSDEEIKSLRRNPMKISDVRTIFKPEFEKFRIGRSYYFPHDCSESFVQEIRGSGVESSRKVDDFEGWHPADILYFPLKSFDGKIKGLVSVDDPVAGERPTEKMLRSVELFIDFATSIIEESEFEAYFNKTKSLISRLFDLSPSMIFVVDENRRIIDINRAVTENLGYNRREITGKPEFSIIASQEEYEKITASRQDSSYLGEVQILGTDGEIWGHLTSVPVYGSQGELDGYINTIVDITEVKRLQQYLVRAEKLAGIGVLVGGIAHEINNPLYAILGLAEAIEDDERIPEEVRPLMKDIIQYTRDASRIVKDLSGYTYAEKKEAPRPEDPAEIIRNALKMVKRANIGSKIRFETDLPDTSPILCLKGEIMQVFVNLMTNAMDAFDSGEGVVRIRLREIADYVECMVTDNGSGMTDEAIQLAF